MKAIVVANWKMNPQSFADARRLFIVTKTIAERMKKVDIIVAAPTIFLRDLRKGYRGKRVSFAAQNMHWMEHGSYTGEISATQLKDAGIQYVLIGHAERRAMGETNEVIARKMETALKAGLKVIFCIGEKERDATGRYLHVIREQIEHGLRNVQKKYVKNIIVAYEPVWAVGKDKAMDGQEMHQMSIYIRKTLVGLFEKAGMDTPVIYGGSVDEIKELEVLTDGEVQGLLLGRASIDPFVFPKLIGAIQVK